MSKRSREFREPSLSEVIRYKLFGPKDPYEQYRLAQLYLYGRFVGRDIPKGMALIEESALNGCAEAQCLLGEINLADARWNPKEAERWFRMAADQGSPKGEYELGMLYYSGELGKKDYDKSFELMASAADKFYVEAYLALGIHYLYGYGTEEDVHKALSWFEKSSDLGYVHAKMNVAMIYLDEESELFDVQKGLGILESAAEEGDDKCQFLLSLVYSDEGKGINDPERSMYWLKRAADNGNEDAIVELDETNSSIGGQE